MGAIESGVRVKKQKLMNRHLFEVDDSAPGERWPVVCVCVCVPPVIMPCLCAACVLLSTVLDACLCLCVRHCFVHVRPVGVIG